MSDEGRRLSEREEQVREHEMVVPNALGELSELASTRSSDNIKELLSTAREQLGMDLAFVSEFTREGQQTYRSLDGDAGSFSLQEDGGIPLEATLCQRMVDSRIPNVIRDVKNDDRVNDLDVASEADIGSYVGIPLRFSDGRLYGTMCTISHSPDPTLRERDVEFMKVLARMVADQLEREELESKNWRLRLKATGVGALLAALEARDNYTGEHSEAVVELSVAVARQLGLSDEEVADIEQAAVLHDIGKIGVPDSLLNKQGPLDADEWKLMREHPAIGERIVASIESLAYLAPVIRAEHERWDGKGYPDGIKGEQIPLASRIILACDAYHAMVSDRPYRKAMGFQEALEELEENAGTQFCPYTTRALLTVLGSTRADERSVPA